MTGSIGNRFNDAMDPTIETDAFLLNVVNHCVDTLRLGKDALLKQRTDGIIGDYHPTPSRCLTCIEPVLNAHLAPRSLAA